MSFNGTTGRMTAFNPNTDGIVNSIALDPADCSTAYIGGKFSTVGGQPATNLAAVDTATGALRTGFKHTATGQVSALVFTHGRVLVGGYFDKVNGVDRAKLASLHPVTGTPDGYLTLGLTGFYPGRTNPTRAYNFTLSHGGDRMLVTGVFTAVGGVHREQVFQLDLGATAATLNPWTSTDFYVHCADSLPFYIQDATYSPDDTTVYIATTGYKARFDPLHTVVCDADGGVPEHRRHGRPQVGQLHRLRLALHRGRGREHRLRRRPPALAERREHLRPRRRRGARPARHRRHGPGHRPGHQLEPDPLPRRRRRRPGDRVRRAVGRQRRPEHRHPVRPGVPPRHLLPAVLTRAGAVLGCRVPTPY